MSRQFVVLDDFADLNKDGRTTTGELLGAVVLFAVGIFCGLTILIGGVYVVFFVDAPGPLKLIAVCAVLAVLLAVGLLALRIFREEREERLRRAEIFRRWRYEEEDRKWRMGLQDAEAQSRFSQADIDAAAWHLLEVYYKKNGRITRDSKDHRLSETMWNQVNRLLQERNIRRGNKRTLEPATIDEAWAMWCKRKLEARSYFVKDDTELIERV